MALTNAYAYADGLAMGVATLAITAALEGASRASVRAIRATPEGRALYREALRKNLVNNLGVGPATYAVVARALGRRARARVLASAARALALVLAHAVGYYCAHRAMHTPRFYWAHRFHHRFHKHIAPSAANAVSVAEYALAYMLPFVVGCALVAPDMRALRAAVAVVSLSNLAIHTPRLEALAVPRALVSTADHFAHHRRLTTHFAAPTVSIDRALDALAVAARHLRGRLVSVSASEDRRSNAGAKKRTAWQ